MRKHKNCNKCRYKRKCLTVYKIEADNHINGTVSHVERFNKIYVYWECICGESNKTEFYTLIGSINSCCYCGKSKPKNDEFYINIVKRDKRVHSVIEIVREVNNYVKVKWKCNCGLVNVTRPDHIGCSSCASNGFDSSIDATFYLAVIKDGCSSIALKYGITNRNHIIRLNEEIRHTNFTYKCLFTFNDVGSIIKEIEDSVKLKFGGSFLTKSRFPDGYTETLEFSKIEELEEFVNAKIEHHSKG